MTTLYDLVPYPSLPHPEAHPDLMAAWATLLGLTPPTLRGARVLDLGCGTAGHLLSLATAHPETHFTGVDLSTVQIDIATQRAQALQLSNLTLLQGDLRDVELGTFDYIICYGTYSWVTPEEQEAILRRVKAHLAPDGVALISYNTLPGWHMLGMIRDMMRFHTRRESSPEARVGAAKELLTFLRDVVIHERTAFSVWLQTVIELLDDVPDAYIFHEFLETENRPVQFYRFTQQLRSHGLSYLTEARYSTTRPDNFPPHIQAILKEESERRGGDRLHVEQCMDYLRNKRFRSSLITHEALASDGEIVPSAVPKVRFRADFTLESGQARSRNGYQLALDTPSLSALYTLLDAQAPRWFTFEEVQETLSMPPEDLIALLNSGFAQELILPGVDPLQLSAQPNERPTSPPLTRLFAQSEAEVPTLLYRTVPLDEDAKHLVLDCDGTKTQGELLTRWRARLEDDESLSVAAFSEALRTLCRRGLLL